MSTPSVEQVRAVISTSMCDNDVALAIADAELIVRGCVDGLDPDVAAAIVKYAAADLISAVIGSKGRGTLTAKALGDASESYASGGAGAEFGKSAYWQRALMLDPNGCLHKLGRRPALFEKV